MAFEKITENHNLVEYLKAHAKRKSRNESNSEIGKGGYNDQGDK